MEEQIKRIGTRQEFESACFRMNVSQAQVFLGVSAGMLSQIRLEYGSPPWPSAVGQRQYRQRAREAGAVSTGGLIRRAINGITVAVQSC